MQVIYQKRFQKKFLVLSEKLKQRFYERLDLFMRDKFDEALNNHSVDTAYPGCRSINITGDYRAIFREEENSVTFITIGTHPQLYG